MQKSNKFEGSNTKIYYVLRVTKLRIIKMSPYVRYYQHFNYQNKQFTGTQKT